MTDVTPQPSQPRWFTDSLAACPVMGVFRGLSPDRTVELADAAWQIGVLNVEIPIESPTAVASLKAAVAAGSSRGLPVGAGTIVTIEQLETAVRAGAAYGVSPGFDPELVAAAASRGFPFIPGVATASELLLAHKAGFHWIKAFPASELGPRWFSAMKGPFPSVNLVATGGVSGKTADQFLRNGASVVGVGSAFGHPEESAALRSLIAEHSTARSKEPIHSTDATRSSE